MNAAPTPSGRRILILPPNWLGDAIMAQPAMRIIAQHHRQDQLSIHGQPWLHDLLPYLDLGHCNFAQNLPAADRAYLFPNSFGSAWRAWRAGCRERIGYRGQWRRPLLTNALSRRLSLLHQHHRLYYLDIPAQLGMPATEREVKLICPAGDREAGIKLMATHGLNPEKAICVAPGAQFGGAKRYPPESYARILSMLAEEGWQPVVLGVESERDIGDRVLTGVDGPTWNAAGQTSLREALQLTSACRLMLCNDSGFMHVAAGLGIPTVTMFGATDPARTSPSGPRVHLLYVPAACSPCLQRECTVAGQPCMANILPEAVRDACLALLAA
jgi:lipopolysaccharide heptosyltransferase II